MLLHSDSLLLHHAAARGERLRAEAAQRGQVVAARRAGAAGHRHALSTTRLRARLARTLTALAARLEPRPSVPRIERGNGSAAARG